MNEYYGQGPNSWRVRAILHMKRCKEQGHEWENCCSIMFEIYQRCKWCGQKRGLAVQTSHDSTTQTLTENKT